MTSTRKVQQVSSGTYTVSIPADWAREYGLEPGATVECYTHLDGSLVIRRDDGETNELDAVRISLEDDDPAVVEDVLRAAYVAGFGRIVLGVTNEQRRSFDSVVRALSGLEIADETASTVTVVGLLKTSETLLRATVRQHRSVTLSICDAVVAALDGEAVDRAAFDEWERESERLTRLVTRSFNRTFADAAAANRLGMRWFELSPFVTTARQFDRLAGCLGRAATTVDGQPGVPSDAVGSEAGSIARSVRALVEKASSAVLADGSVANTRALLADSDRIVERAQAVDVAGGTGTRAETQALTRALDSLTTAAECGGTIAETALQAALFPSPDDAETDAG